MNVKVTQYGVHQSLVTLPRVSKSIWSSTSLLLRQLLEVEVESCLVRGELDRALTKPSQVSRWCYRHRRRWNSLTAMNCCWNRRLAMMRGQLLHISRSSMGAETKSVADLGSESESPGLLQSRCQPPFSLGDRVRICGFLSNRTP